MPAFSFQKRFVPHILSGAKEHTIRAWRKHPAKVGDLLSLYYAMRTKQCELLMRRTCTQARPIVIANSGEWFTEGKGDHLILPQIEIEGSRLARDEMEALAVRDGFASLFENGQLLGPAFEGIRRPDHPLALFGDRPPTLLRSRRMKYVLKHLSLAFALSAPAYMAQAQTTVNIQASSCIENAAGAPVSGTLTVQASDGNGNPIPFTANGTLRTRGPATFTITNGSLVGSLVVPNPAVTSPTSIGYTFTINDSVAYTSTTFKSVQVTPDGSGNFNLCSILAGNYIQAVPVVYVNTGNGGNGAAATVTVGSTTTGAAGSSAAVTNAGTTSAAVLNFVIPQGLAGAAGAAGATGPTGAAGATPNFTIGTVTPLSAGASPTVSISGTAPNYTLNLGIPAGAQGTQGPAGSQGATGNTGATGAAGATPTFTIGTVTPLAAGATPTVTISGTAPNYTLNLGIPAGATGATGAAGSQGAQGNTGATGAAGATPTFTIGTVTGLSAGSTPTVTISGTAPNYTLNLGIPAGAQGATGNTGATGATGAAGATPTFTIGAVTGLSAGSTPTVTISGTAPNYTLNLGLPAGAAGATGAQGTTGATGAAGVTPTFTIGTVTALAAGATPTVTISGTAPSYTLNLGIPAGAAGATGAAGAAGSTGATGPAGPAPNCSPAALVKSSSGTASCAVAGTDYDAAGAAATVQAASVQLGAASTGQFSSSPYALTYASSLTVNFANGLAQNLTLTGNSTLTFSNAIAGARYILELTQDSTGSRTVTWPSIRWAGGSAPTLTTTASKTDLIVLIYDGTNWFGQAALNF